MLSRIGQLFRRFSQAAPNEYRDRLSQATTKLAEEAQAMRRDVGTAGSKKDPIRTVVKNILQVRDREEKT